MIKVEGNTVELLGVEPIVIGELAALVNSLNKSLIKRGVSEEIAKKRIMYAVELGFKNEEELAAEAEQAMKELSNKFIESLMKGLGV